LKTIIQSKQGGLPPLPGLYLEKLYRVWIIPHFIVTQWGQCT